MEVSAYPPSSRTPRRTPSTDIGRLWLALALILVVAALARFWGLGDQSIWFDEGWSMHVAEQSLPEALRQLSSAGHTHPPGYYVLLMAWLRLWGTSVVAARALSALLGVWAIWQVYRLGQELFAVRTGLVAAAILALAPAHVVYSQEVRMYALLLLALTAVWRYFYLLGSRGQHWGMGNWIALVAWEIVAVYTHFFAFLPLATVTGWLLVQLFRRVPVEGYRTLWRWLASQVLVFLAFTPWLGIALQRTAEHSTIGTHPPQLLALGSEVWAFLIGGHLALQGREALFGRLALVCLGMIFVLAIWRWTSAQDRGAASFLGLQALGPFALVFVMTQIRPGFHPRYTLMLLVPVVVLLALGVVKLAEGHRWRKVAAGAALVIWILTAGTAAHALITDPYYRRDDARATAGYLQAVLPARAPVLLSIDDWALQYYLREAPLSVHVIEASGNAAVLEQACTNLLVGHPEAALVQWYQGTSDLRGVLPYVLERQGRLTRRERLSGYTVAHYALSDAQGLEVQVDAEIRFGALTLETIHIETAVPSDDALAVALAWRVEQPLDTDLKVALDVVDTGERSCASTDTLLCNASGDGTTEWGRGEVITTFARLDLPVGLPPSTYTLRISLYDEASLTALDVLDVAGAPAGQYADACEVTLLPATQRFDEPPPADMFHLETEIQAPVAPGLYLLGSTVASSYVSTGESIAVALGWYQAAEEPLPTYDIELRLVREGEVLASISQDPAYGQYPTNQWAPGEIVLDHRELPVPIDASTGVATLQVSVSGQQAVDLTQVSVDAVVRGFAAPRPAFAASERLGSWASLVGFDLAPAAVAVGQPIVLTLYWRAEATPTQEYVVFTHLLDEQGRLLAQHDGIPCEGLRAPTSWVRGEYLRDPHRLEWSVPAYQGTAMIEVGLYDPKTGERLLTPSGARQIYLSPQLDFRP